MTVRHAAAILALIEADMRSGLIRDWQVAGDVGDADYATVLKFTVQNRQTHTHDLNLTEVRMSDCEFGCKVWLRECCGEELVIHSETYGCPGGAA